MIADLQLTIGTQSGNKVFRKKLRELKTSPIIANSPRGKQIFSAVDGALVGG
jgi:hypothetical protein